MTRGTHVVGRVTDGRMPVFGCQPHRFLSTCLNPLRGKEDVGPPQKNDRGVASCGEDETDVGKGESGTFRTGVACPSPLLLLTLNALAVFLT